VQQQHETAAAHSNEEPTQQKQHNCQLSCVWLVWFEKQIYSESIAHLERSLPAGEEGNSTTQGTCKEAVTLPLILRLWLDYRMSLITV
jgi:hypothetical protein